MSVSYRGRTGRIELAARWRVAATLLLSTCLLGCRAAESASPAEQNKELVRRFYEELISTGDVERLDEFVTPDYVEVHEHVRYQLGVEGLREHILGVRLTYPDLALTVEQQIAEGEWVVSCVTMRGTHLGEWIGMAPTGKRVEITAVNVDRVVVGRIAEHGGAANLLGPLLQIGAVRVVGAGGS